eukprot:1342697-Prorocentrum_lima.AAC.1
MVTKKAFRNKGQQKVLDTPSTPGQYSLKPRWLLHVPRGGPMYLLVKVTWMSHPAQHYLQCLFSPL